MKKIDPDGVGRGLRTKINVNLCISKDCSEIDLEMNKVKMALVSKAESEHKLFDEGASRYSTCRVDDLSRTLCAMN